MYDSLGDVTIDLSGVARRTLVYEAARNPFALSLFEQAPADDLLTKGRFRLQGVVLAGRAGPDGAPVRLAIINDRVYAVGQKVAPGVRVAAVEETWVVLTNGKAEARLELSGARPLGGAW